MRPQDGCGGWVPRPRYDKAASARMASANWMVACTINSDRTFGNTCSMVMLKFPLPDARAASTNSLAQIALADARVTRTKVGIWKMPMAAIEVTIPGPATAASMIAERMAGNAKVKS